MRDMSRSASVTSHGEGHGVVTLSRAYDSPSPIPNPKDKSSTAALYVERLGLRGTGAEQALAAFAENPAGSAAAAETALRKGQNPAGLFLQMLRDGDHLTEQAEPWRDTSVSEDWWAAHDDARERLRRVEDERLAAWLLTDEGQTAMNGGEV